MTVYGGCQFAPIARTIRFADKLAKKVADANQTDTFQAQ
jgi:hypothetical protein